MEALGIEVVAGSGTARQRPIVLDFQAFRRTPQNDREMPHGAAPSCASQEIPPGLVAVRVEVDGEPAGRVAVGPQDTPAMVNARVGAVVRYVASKARR